VPDAPGTDPLALFAALDPVDEESLAATSAHGPAQATLAEIVAGQRSVVRLLPSRRAQHRRWTMTVGAAALMASTAAAAWIVTRPADNPLAIACYAQPSLQGEIAGVTPSETDPIEACANVWRNGAFSGRGPVPPLIGCVNRRGIAAVFPSASPAFCDTLGFDRLGDAPPSDAPIITLQGALSEAFRARGCILPEEAVGLVRSELDRRGLTDWRINNPGPYTPSRPCGSLSFDPEGRAVTLVPLPAQPPSSTTTAPPSSTTTAPTGGTTP
jgi:hypothetical protein